MPQQFDKFELLLPVVKSPSRPSNSPTHPPLSPTHPSLPLASKTQSPRDNLDEFEVLEDTKDFEVVKDNHGFEVIEHTDAPSRGRAIAAGALATFNAIRKSNTLWYSSHLIAAILSNNYLGAITAIGHLSVIVAQQCGYNIPSITHTIIKYSSYVYRYKIVNKMIAVGQYLSKPRLVPATSIFAKNMDLILYRLGQEILSQRLEQAQVAYDRMSVLADNRSLLRWCLLALRGELIRLGVYSPA